MARKNLIGISDTPSDAPIASPVRDDRPIAGFIPAAPTGGPVGGITRTLGNITEKVERAQMLERQLAEGQAIVELETAQIDSSFINDRFSIDPTELDALVEQIRDHGQQVPILVRPHPRGGGRFQVAYGHRRLAAARKLGIKVRAVVKELSDEQLVVSQGQENNSRTDLSYIERALFAARLEERSFSRDVIMAALGIDKAALSRMIGVIRDLPEELILAVGAAPSVGRRRWMELADMLQEQDPAPALDFLTGKDVVALPSNERFDALIRHLTEPQVKQVREWQTVDTVPVRMKTGSSGATFVFNGKAAPGFDEFVKRKLVDLYTEYRKQTGD
ncbi:plasmid partitioning protein RepB [Rhizobium binxianense]